MGATTTKYYGVWRPSLRTIYYYYYYYYYYYHHHHHITLPCHNNHSSSASFCTHARSLSLTGENVDQPDPSGSHHLDYDFASVAHFTHPCSQPYVFCPVSYQQHRPYTLSTPSSDTGYQTDVSLQRPARIVISSQSSPAFQRSLPSTARPLTESTSNGLSTAAIT